MDNLPAPVAPGPHDGCPPGAGTIFPEHGGQIGNPPHEVTETKRELVRALTKVMPNYMIAEELGIAEGTLYKYYSAELGAGKREVTKSLGSTIIKKAMAGDLRAAEIWLKTWGGWNEPHRVELSGPGGGPIPVAAIHAHLAGKTDDELAVIEQLFGALLTASGYDPAGNGIDPSGGGGGAADYEADPAQSPDGGDSAP